MTAFLKWLLLIPIAVVIIAFAFINRHTVPVSFDPTGTNIPGLVFQMPLFAVVFASIMIGVVIGGIADWIKQGKHRKAARAAKAEAQQQRNEANRLRAQVAALPPGSSGRNPA